jgi:drug/metabolite transporter (DMT)-like permease
MCDPCPQPAVPATPAGSVAPGAAGPAAQPVPALPRPVTPAGAGPAGAGGVGASSVSASSAGTSLAGGGAAGADPVPALAAVVPVAVTSVPASSADASPVAGPVVSGPVVAGPVAGPVVAGPVPVLATPATIPARAPRAWTGVAAGAAAQVCVGGSVAVSGVLAGAPLYTAEAVRYAAACLLLAGYLRLTRQRLARPRGTEWLWLAGVTATGLVLFNVALVEGARHAEPAVLGVAVASVPALLAVFGPLLEGTRPMSRAVLAAVVVTSGAALVTGTGRADPAGLAWAAVVLGCETCFTLLAVPVLGRHGPGGVSVHATWMATVAFTMIGLAREGPAAVARLRPADWLAVGYLAVAVTAVAFVLWYSCVRRLGAGRAGLLTGLAPVAAAGTGLLLGAPAPRPLVWAGMAVVAAGLILGLRPARPPG